MTFLEQHAIYIVLIIALVVWGGIFAYLFRLDRRIGDLERTLKQQ